MLGSLTALMLWYSYHLTNSDIGVCFELSVCIYEFNLSLVIGKGV